MGISQRISLRHLATERQAEADYRGLAYGHLHGDTRSRRNDRHTHTTSMIYHDSIRYPATTGAPACFTTRAYIHSAARGSNQTLALTSDGRNTRNSVPCDSDDFVCFHRYEGALTFFHCLQYTSRRHRAIERLFSNRRKYGQLSPVL